MLNINPHTCMRCFRFSFAVSPSRRFSSPQALLSILGALAPVLSNFAALLCLVVEQLDNSFSLHWFQNAAVMAIGISSYLEVGTSPQAVAGQGALWTPVIAATALLLNQVCIWHGGLYTMLDLRAM